MDQLADFAIAYWRPLLIAALTLVFAALFLKTQVLRPVLMIFWAFAVWLAIAIEAPTPEATRETLAALRASVFGAVRDRHRF